MILTAMAPEPKERDETSPISRHMAAPRWNENTRGLRRRSQYVFVINLSVFVACNIIVHGYYSNYSVDILGFTGTMDFHIMC